MPKELGCSWQQAEDGIALATIAGENQGPFAVDSELVPFLKVHPWHWARGYVCTGIPNVGEVGLSALVVACGLRKLGFVVDHVNGCKSDNRLDNLRIIPHDLNCTNQLVRTNRSALGRGVYKHHAGYRLVLNLHGVTIRIGGIPRVETAKLMSDAILWAALGSRPDSLGLVGNPFAEGARPREKPRDLSGQILLSFLAQLPDREGV